MGDTYKHIDTQTHTQIRVINGDVIYFFGPLDDNVFVQKQLFTYLHRISIFRSMEQKGFMEKGIF